MAASVVVILAAGQGTRMRSQVPKLLHPLCGREMIRWPVAAAVEAGAGTVVVVDSPGEPLRATLGERASTVVQQSPRGTADAVRAAAPLIDRESTVIVLYGDVPLITPGTIGALEAAHHRWQAAATILTAELDDPSGYGRVVRAPDGSVERVVETKVPGDATQAQLSIREVSTGIFAFAGGELLDALALVSADNAQGEFYLPDVLPIMGSRGGTIAAMLIDDPSETLGVNDRRALAAARVIAQRRIIDRHLLAGTAIVDPATTVIDVEVTLGQDTVVAPFSSLHGTTSVGSGSTIGPHSTLIDTRVGDGATIVHSYLSQADVGDGVSVGPFAYLRPGAVLREGSKAGTFVEIKGSTIGARSKVPHLSYVGDAEVGEDTNLGAGTITANYDGSRKHRTTIGARVKTSVHTTLVAPVAVGDEAVTAAGSVIGQDVPPGALAGSPGVARSAQRNVEGYGERRRDQAPAAERSDPAPQDRSDLAPQDRSDPAPQDRSDPAPQDRSDPAPQDRSDPAPHDRS